MESIKNWLIKAAIKTFYFLRLRVLTIKLQRLIMEPNPKRTKIPKFLTPRDIEKYISLRFKYRLDELIYKKKAIALDWVSDPEVFQTRLMDPRDLDGDCDDYHYWVAHNLSLIKTVSNVKLVSVVWNGNGHTVCCYFYKRNWYLFNYKIIKIDSPNEIPALVMKAHAPDKKMVFYVFEDLDFNLLAISPETVAEVVAP